jgi:hypothetical protein
VSFVRAVVVDAEFFVDLVETAGESRAAEVFIRICSTDLVLTTLYFAADYFQSNYFEDLKKIEFANRSGRSLN